MHGYSRPHKHNVSLGALTPAVSLTGLSYRDSTSVTGGIANVSIMGGVPIYIRSNGGFDVSPSNNEIELESKALSPKKFKMPELSGKRSLSHFFVRR